MLTTRLLFPVLWPCPWWRGWSFLHGWCDGPVAVSVLEDITVYVSFFIPELLSISARGHCLPVWVLAFQAWQNFSPNWLIYPCWRRNICALFIGLYCQSSSESAGAVQTHIMFRVTVERYVLTELFSLHWVRWTSLSCVWYPINASFNV